MGEIDNPETMIMGGLSPIKHREVSQKDNTAASAMPPESFGDGKNYFINMEIDKKTYYGGDDVSNIAEA